MLKAYSAHMSHNHWDMSYLLCYILIFCFSQLLAIVGFAAMPPHLLVNVPLHFYHRHSHMSLYWSCEFTTQFTQTQLLQHETVNGCFPGVWEMVKLTLIICKQNTGLNWQLF